jgi:hypothetical protein
MSCVVHIAHTDINKNCIKNVDRESCMKEANWKDLGVGRRRVVKLILQN